MSDKEIKQATEKVIREMLTESTGKHFMDSGDAYGRHWEENQRDGIKTGYQICDFYIDEEKQTCELIPVIPIFDVFTNMLKYTDECKYLESLIPSHLTAQEPLFWIEAQTKQGHKDFKENTYVGTYVANSYNIEHLLTQDYMYVYFTYNDDPYVAISIHNGCDIRGGYTDVHIFDVGYEDDFITAQNDVSIDCLHTDGEQHICEGGYQVYCGLANEYYSHLEQKDVDEHYIYQHTYVDKDKKLRCKECDGLIVCNALTY